ncbi:hypothetical protein SPFM15_00167 [Salmonella phage SPFM15]|nr:hypothetical protein SPFM5_00162 [Salmonella phage SPFM5]VFR13791.1 hypothetical protein SPFM15_00167 [Salmonella phage SPFM15]
MCIDRVDPNSDTYPDACIYIAISTSTRTAERRETATRGNGGLLMNLRWPIAAAVLFQERRGGASG